MDETQVEYVCNYCGTIIESCWWCPSCKRMEGDCPQCQDLMAVHAQDVSLEAGWSAFAQEIGDG